MYIKATVQHKSTGIYERLRASTSVYERALSFPSSYDSIENIVSVRALPKGLTGFAFDVKRYLERNFGLGKERYN